MVLLVLILKKLIQKFNLITPSKNKLNLNNLKKLKNILKNINLIL